MKIFRIFDKTVFRVIPVILLTTCIVCACKNDNNNEIEETLPEELLIPLGKKITVDGVVNSTEWDDAQKIEINMSGHPAVEVLLKHDGTNVLIFFNLHNPDANNVVFPEIVFDPNNDKSNTWMNDDWWFHVSATDCESKGNHGSYSNCELEQPDWEAVPNFEIGVPSNVSEIEVSIPFSKVGIVQSKNFGFAIHITDLNTRWKLWPATANLSKPSLWSNAKLKS